MKLFRTKQGNVLEAAGKYYHMDQPWDELVNRDGLYSYLEKTAASEKEMPATQDKDWLEKGILPPIGSQEVCAAAMPGWRNPRIQAEPLFMTRCMKPTGRSFFSSPFLTGWLRMESMSIYG